jgi:hypothetical protein
VLLCRPDATHRQRIEEVAARRLVEKFSREPDQLDGTGVDVAPTATGVAVEVGAGRTEITREQARALAEQLSAAVAQRREFVRTTGFHREDGSYVVERRGADSSGHRKVFERFDALARLYDRQPATFTAEDVGRSGLTGGRRHMVLRHLVEHPAFDCELASRQPLTVEKCGEGDAGADAAPTPPEVSTAGD